MSNRFGMDIQELFKPKEKLTAAQIAEAEKALNLAGEMARQCLELKDFKIFKEKYQDAEAKMVSTMISYTKNFVESANGDVNKYAITMVRLFTKLENLRYLLDTVEVTALRGAKEKKDAV